MYGSTWADMAVTPPELSWQMLRSLRHEPPGRAVRGARKATFDAALEQPEQLFAAAAGAGPETRPLLAFYGLSQAGRAVAAASTDAGSGEWELAGHGIRAAELEGAGSAGLAAVTVPTRATGRSRAWPGYSARSRSLLGRGSGICGRWCPRSDGSRCPGPGRGRR